MKMERGCAVGIYRLRAPKNLTPKLRALPSRFFFWECALFFLEGAFLCALKTPSRFFFWVWALFFLEGAFFRFFFNCDLSDSCYVLSMFFSVQSHVQPLLIVYSCLLFFHFIYLLVIVVALVLPRVLRYAIYHLEFLPWKTNISPIWASILPERR